MPDLVMPDPVMAEQGMVLVLDASSGAASSGGASCLAALVGDGVPVAEQRLDGPGGAVRLAPVLRAMLAAEGLAFARLSAIAVVVGPGSFTGMRASLALAHGLALADALPVTGVTVGEAFGIAQGGVWCVTMARKGRVFLERPHTPPAAFPLEAMPPLPEGVVLVGDAAPLVAAAQDLPPARLGPAHPSSAAIAEAALARRCGKLPPRAALPLYVDAPEAKKPTARP